jgi:hypothetical protein
MTLNHKADSSTRKAEDLVNTTLDHLRTIREENEAESTTATYAREEVNGPLKGVGREEVVIEQEETTISEGGTNRPIKETHKKFLGMTSSEENVNHAQFLTCVIADACVSGQGRQGRNLNFLGSIRNNSRSQFLSWN